MYAQSSSSSSSSVTTGESIRVVSGVRDIVDSYDTFLLDMWGVMHDGTNAYEGVLDAIQQLKEAGKDLVILSNSSKRQDNSMKMLRKLGFNPADFSQIITSGEVAYHMLSRTSPANCDLAPQPWNVLESIYEENNDKKLKVLCFGSGDGDQEYLESCGWSIGNVEDADMIVARGTFTIHDGTNVIDKTTDGEELYFQAHNKLIEAAAKRRIPMIVANPDKIRPDADRSPMPGTIGSFYQKALLGDSSIIGSADESLVKYLGKPFADVYEIALRGKDRSKACMIGDALETDVAGGSAETIDTIWVVRDGIHDNDIETKGGGSLEKGCAAVLEEFNKLEDTYAKGRTLSPAMVMPHFRW